MVSHRPCPLEACRAALPVLFPAPGASQPSACTSPTPALPLPSHGCVPVCFWGHPSYLITPTTTLSPQVTSGSVQGKGFNTSYFRLVLLRSRAYYDTGTMLTKVKVQQGVPEAWTPAHGQQGVHRMGAPPSGGTEMLSIRAGSQCQMLSPSQQGHRDAAAGLPRARPTQTREEGTAAEHTKRSTWCQRTSPDILHTCGTVKDSQLGIFHPKDTSNNILQL